MSLWHMNSTKLLFLNVENLSLLSTFIRIKASRIIESAFKYLENIKSHSIQTLKNTEAILVMTTTPPSLPKVNPTATEPTPCSCTYPLDVVWFMLHLNKNTIRIQFFVSFASVYCGRRNRSLPTINLIFNINPYPNKIPLNSQFYRLDTFIFTITRSSPTVFQNSYRLLSGSPLFCMQSGCIRGFTFFILSINYVKNGLLRSRSKSGCAFFGVVSFVFGFCHGNFGCFSFFRSWCYKFI